MKYTVIFLLISYLGFSQGKSIGYPKDLIKETKSIMKSLSFSVRQNQPKDDSIQIVVVDSFKVLNAKFGSLLSLNNMIVPENNFALVYYLKPCIRISLLADSILNHKKDTTKITFIKAQSIIVHELTHYLQSIYNQDYFSMKTMDEYAKYISQPDEFEAHAVGAYYFLKYSNKELLNKTMSLKVSSKRRNELLINAYIKEVYPWRKLPFAQ